MVHDHEEEQPNARKRSYPFIQWVNPGSSPPRSKTPDTEADLPSLPSPPLQSNKYKIFKQDLDRFGGRLHSSSGLGRDIKVEEKHRIRKTSWAEADREIDRNHSSSKPKYCLSSEDSVTKLSKFKTDVLYHKTANSEIPPSSEKKKKERHVAKARENEMHVSSSGQDYDTDSLRSTSFDEEEPGAKRPKYSVEIREIPAEEDKEYQPNIAESIKLRKPSESRRKKSESYDESDARTIKRILSSSSILDDKKLSLTNNCKLTNRLSSHPYIKKSTKPALTGTNIKMVPRSSLLQPSLEASKEATSDEPPKIYIQIPQTNGGENHVHASTKHTSDRNHNKVKDNGYDSRKVTISNIAGEVKYKKASGVHSHSQPRPSSTGVSSSTEVHNGDNTEEEDEHDGYEDAVNDPEKEDAGVLGGLGGRVTLQQSHTNRNGFGSDGGQAYWSSSQHKERPTPYSRDSHQSFKQVCRSRKFNTRYPAPEKPRQKRAVIQDMVRPLKQWLLRHRHNPYPTKGEKVQLAVGSNMTLVQVSNWFANARRRLKNVVQESRCSWSKRLRLYNQFVQGNAELLSISSDDSIWNSGDEEDGEKSDTGNTDDFEEAVAGVINEHSYTLVGGEGHQLGSDSEGQGSLEIDLEPKCPVLQRETCSPHRDESGSGASSPEDRLSRGSTTPTGSDSPPCSLPDNDNIPDTQKYKNRMLVRYLNDAEEAQRHNNRKNSQTSTSVGTNGDFSSEDGDVYPDQSNLSVGQDLAGHEEASPRTLLHRYETPPTLLPETEQWQPVDSTQIPTPSNNITISFTTMPHEKDFVPVLTQPPRDNMGVDKVKRQLDLSNEGAGATLFPSPPNQTMYVSLPTVPLPSDQFSNGFPMKSEDGRSNSSSPISSVSTPTKVFPTHSLRPPFMGSILPGPFPFPYPSGPINGWSINGWTPMPFPHFLHLQPPDPNHSGDAPPRVTPPPWPGLPTTAGPQLQGSPTWGRGGHPPPQTQHPRWGEMEAAMALSQLANCPVSGGSLGGSVSSLGPAVHPAPSPSCT